LDSYAWALGDFAVIRYRAGSRKLAPVLDEAELRRFARELMQLSGCAMSAAVLNRALAGRFGLENPSTVELEGSKTDLPETSWTEEEVVLRDTAKWIVEQFSERQREVLRLSEDEGIAQIAEALGCSNATVFNEQRRIGVLVDRFSADPRERDQLLKMSVDLLYPSSDE
jgi:DNA-directed RNA polymerase specialized sigma24 family protein